MNTEEYFEDVKAGKVKRAKWKFGDEPACPWCGKGNGDFHGDCREQFRIFLSTEPFREVPCLSS